MAFFKRSSGWFFFISLVLYSFFVPHPVIAQQITLTPTLGLRGEYDDNIAFTRSDELDDYLFIISPGLTFNYSTEVLKLESVVLADIIRYTSETDLDTENQKYSLKGDYRIMERWTLLGDFSYLKDTTLDSNLEETGRVTRRQNRERTIAGGGFSYKMTELSDFGFDYTFTNTNFQRPTSDDYDSSRYLLSYNQRLKNQVDMFTLRPGYINRDSDASDLDVYLLTVGWTRQFSETVTLRAFVGGRYSREDFKDDRGNDDGWGMLADVNFEKTGELSSTVLGYRRDLRTNTNGTEIQVDRFYLRYRQRVYHRLGVRFTGQLYFSKATSNQPDDENTRFYRLTPAIFYMLTENHTMSLNYSYANDKDKSLQNDETADRNRVWLAFDFEFPFKW